VAETKSQFVPCFFYYIIIIIAEAAEYGSQHTEVCIASVFCFSTWKSSEWM